MPYFQMVPITYFILPHIRIHRNIDTSYPSLYFSHRFIEILMVSYYSHIKRYFKRIPMNTKLIFFALFMFHTSQTNTTEVTINYSKKSIGGLPLRLVFLDKNNKGHVFTLHEGCTLKVPDYPFHLQFIYKEMAWRFRVPEVPNPYLNVICKNNTITIELTKDHYSSKILLATYCLKKNPNDLLFVSSEI